MTFPVRIDKDARSILSRIADNCKSKEHKKQLSLSSFYEFIPMAFKEFGLSLGSSEEFFDKIYPHCTQDLSKNDIKIQNEILKKTFLSSQRASKSLEECLQHNLIPSFKVAVPPLIKFITKTGMAVEGKDDWLWFLNRYYRDDIDKDENLEAIQSVEWAGLKDAHSEVKQKFYDQKQFIENFKLTAAQAIIDQLRDKIKITPDELVRNHLINISDQNMQMGYLQTICKSILVEEVFCSNLRTVIKSSILNMQSSKKKSFAN